MIEITVLSAGTLLLIALAFTGLGVVSYLTYCHSGRIFQALFLAIASVSILSTLLAGRVLRFGDHGLDVYLEGGTGSTFFEKSLLVILVGVTFSICVAWCLWRLGNKQPLMRYTTTGTTEISRLTWSFVFYFIAFSLLPLAFAPRFEFHVSLVYSLFIWLALLLMLRTTTIDPVLVIRQALGLIVLSSLAAAVFMPSLALQPGYVGLIPGFNMRLWGTTASANTLGSVAGTLLVMQFADKARRPLLHFLLTVCTVVALVFSQSKSAMGGALLGIAILFAWRIWRGNLIRTLPSATRIMAGTAILLSLSAVIVASLWLILSTPAFKLMLERSLDARAMGGISTLTGRTDIWELAIRRGMESPWFGQGLAMWDIQTRLTTGLSGAVHAHNLFLQAFSRSGFVGVISLLVLLVAIIRLAFRAAPSTGGGSLALLAVFLVRSITEVPLQPNGILGGEFFAFMALLVYSIDRGLQIEQTSPSDASGRSPKDTPVGTRSLRTSPMPARRSLNT